MHDGAPAETGELRTIVTEDREHLAEQAGELLLAVIEEAIGARGEAWVILAGGTTPGPAYARLALGLRDRAVPIGKISWLIGDERWVPRIDPQSNEGMARESLLGPIRAPEATIASWNAGEGDPVEKAARYAARIEEARARGAGGPDLVILGMGADGHTASLFPGATALLPDGRRIAVAPRMTALAAAVEGPPSRGWRLTLCPDFLRTSRHVVFLVAGSDRAPALRRARQGDPATPAAWIRGAQTHFIVTRDAMGTEREAGDIRFA